MKISVYFGTDSNTKQVLTDIRTLKYPEIYVAPVDLYLTLEQIVKNFEAVNGELRIVTLSPLVLNITEVLSKKRGTELLWYQVGDSVAECVSHEEIYKQIASVFQEMENLTWE